MNSKEIKEIFTSYNPNYSNVTLNVYVNTMENLLSDKDFDITSNEKIIKYLKDRYSQISTRKTKLATIITFLRAKGKEDKELKKLINEFKEAFKIVDETAGLNILSEADEGQLPEKADINDVYEYYVEKNDPMMITVMTILKEIPLRNELTTVKIRNYNKEKDNYIEKDQLILNQRKNKKAYEYTLSSAARDALDIWMMKNPTDNLLITKYGEPLTSTAFSNKMSRVFKKVTGKKVGTGRIRKAFVSEKLKDYPTYNEIKKDADLLGHSVDVHLKYYKKDIKDLKE